MNTAAMRLAKNLGDEISDAFFHLARPQRNIHSRKNEKNEAIRENHLSETASTNKIAGRERSEPKNPVCA
jgi:hypothetical protein